MMMQSEPYFQGRAVSSRRAFFLLSVLTCVLLFYVHARVSVLQVSYAIQEKEKRLSKLSDEFRNCKFQVSKLRSLNYLDKRRREIDSSLVVPETVKAIRVPIEKQTQATVEPPPAVKHGAGLFLGIMKEAQAKMVRE